jgi:hypothetical protein
MGAVSCKGWLDYSLAKRANIFKLSEEGLKSKPGSFSSATMLVLRVQLDCSLRKCNQLTNTICHCRFGFLKVHAGSLVSQFIS